uniref:Uncharacterized protein n=1 Tax=Avena sativa TaxID=4498 RepID=A0ACD5XFH6_AVESA
MVWPYAVSSICFFGFLFLVLAFWFGRFRRSGDPGFGHMLFYRPVFLHSILSGRLFCWSISARLGSGDSLFSSRLGPGDPFCARLFPSSFSPLLGSRVGACVLISVGDRLVASALLNFLVVCYWGISCSLSLDCWCSLSLFQTACCCSFLLQSLPPSGGALSLLRGWFVLRVLLTAFLTRAVPSSSVSVLYTVEFQKRGLPHGHILVWLKRLDTEMPISPLSDLNLASRDWTVHVYVSRLWQHRGATDDGPIKHTDIVFLDAQGNHMYGEISPLLVPEFIERIREGKVYELRRFLVCPNKNYFRPVEGNFMIRFSRYTTVTELSESVMDYPLCTYALTPIDDLPAPVDLPTNFIDVVVGIITGVSPTSQYHSASRSTPSTKRIVYLSDLSGFEINVVLWGERATAFDGEGVLRTAQNGPVVVLFVGTLVKPFEGRRSLSGGAPCHWYINEDLPEINELLEQLKDKVPAVRGITLQGQTAAEISAQVELETKTLAELAALDIYDYKKTKFYCTVVLTKLSPRERWWFHACTACGRGTIPYGAAYRCPKKECGGTGGTPRYRAYYLGSDGTAEIEFVFFEKADRELIGKLVLTLIRASAPNAMSVDEAIHFARTDQTIPRELSSVVLKKYRMVVSVSSKSFLPESMENSYQVHRVEVQQGKHAPSPSLGRKLGLAMASTSSSAGTSGLSPAGQALAGNLLLTQTNSSGTSTPLSDPPACSTVDSGSLLPQTPPSVTKPNIPLGGKDKPISSVQRALFMEDSPEHESGTKTTSVFQDQPKEMSQLQSEEAPVSVVVGTHVPPSPATTDSTEKTMTRKRPPSSKAQAAAADGTLKKRKN